MKSINELIRQKRIHLGMTQERLAKSMGLENSQMIYNIEAGKVRLPPKHFKAISKVLEIPLTLLVSRHLQAIRSDLMAKLDQ